MPKGQDSSPIDFDRRVNRFRNPDYKTEAERIEARRLDQVKYITSPKGMRTVKRYATGKKPEYMRKYYSKNKDKFDSVYSSYRYYAKNYTVAEIQAQIKNIEDLNKKRAPSKQYGTSELKQRLGNVEEAIKQFTPEQIQRFKSEKGKGRRNRFRNRG
jgi:hypothetical protein